MLLAAETIFLAHMPDFNRTRDEWRQSDIYRLYREPAVQDFLRKPLDNMPNSRCGSQTLQEIEQLDPKNAFFALTSISDKQRQVLWAVFVFEGPRRTLSGSSANGASMLLEQRPGTKGEKLQYQGHEIDVVAATPFTLATTYDRPWFFAATNVTELKALLDRVDHRAKDSEETLDKDEAYRDSRLAPAIELRSVFLSATQGIFRATCRVACCSPIKRRLPARPRMLEKMRCIAGSYAIRERKNTRRTFSRNAKAGDWMRTLNRSSLTLGTKETFFYLAMLLNLGEKMETLNQAATAGRRGAESLSGLRHQRDRSR